MIRRRIRAAPAALSVLVTGALLAGFVGLGGVGTLRARPERPLAVFDLAAPFGSEEARDERRPSTAPLPPMASPPAAPSPASPAPPITPPTPVVVPPVPVPVPMPVQVAPALSSAPSDAAAASSSRPAAAAPIGEAEARPAAPHGMADSPVANTHGVSRAYAARVRAWLLAHQIYPRYARMRRIEGNVRVRFTLDRAGRLLDGAVVRPSGEASLDREGEAMLDRSSPYPAAPPEIGGDRIVMTADIDFLLQH